MKKAQDDAPRVALFAIGTELTTGQILNGNAQWLSRQLKLLGLECKYHITLPDDRGQILETIERLQDKIDMFIFTGGLGPTSDDFTREVIAEWKNKKLIWNEQAWDHITSYMLARGSQYREIQKQECYFPENSMVLKNEVGTAWGFALTDHAHEVYVLPGPPPEIENIWVNHLKAMIEKKCINIDPIITKSWDCLGLGESAIAEICEREALPSSVEISYRVHVPYVEVKLSFRRSLQKEVAPYLAAFDLKLKDVAVLKDGEDIASKLAALINNKSLEFSLNHRENQYLWKRMEPVFKNAASVSIQSVNHTLQGKYDLQILIENRTKNKMSVTLQIQGEKFETELASPFTAASMQKRSQQYLSEMCLIFCYDKISSKLKYNV
jgi:nicotinamide-nucleotide amidase